jgi:hypothetical protein
MKQPPGFVDSTLPSHVCRLHKFLYGLKQALRAWYTRLNDFLLSIDFCASKVDTSLFIFSVGADICYLLVYVNDILLTGSNSLLFQRLIQLPTSEFKLRDLGNIHFYTQSIWSRHYRIIKIHSNGWNTELDIIRNKKFTTSNSLIPWYFTHLK